MRTDTTIGLPSPGPRAAAQAREIQRYLDEPSAAAYLGLSPRTLQLWRRTGEGPPFSKLSARCLRYDVRELDAWMAERTRTSTSDTGSAA